MPELTERLSMKGFPSILNKITTPICQQHGFIKASILFDWEMIVGAKFARICQPEKIFFPPNQRNHGVLYVATSSGFAPELSYLEGMIIDIINKYYGYNAVCRLVIRHKKIMPSLTPANSPPLKPLSEEQRSFIEKEVEGVKDSHLQSALRKLGVGIFQNDSGTASSSLG